ncbi:hypothetical protein [Cellulomonas sp. ICMP 17802]|uniref:hypothetical protein n=1 Tax=Cellulomonas sp. ICMP 17802 TaxID=3239199 RepID=UPI00351B9BCE
MPVVAVEDWSATFHLRPDVERSSDPGPAWVPATAVMVGLALIAATWSAGSPWRLVAALAGVVFVVAWAYVALAVGGLRGEVVGYGVATVAWMCGAWSLTTGIGAEPIGVVVVAVGAAGQVRAMTRIRRVALRRREAIGELADGARRIDGWVVASAGAPWQRALTIGAADGSGRTWTAEHRAWRELRPAVGHPVGIWSTTAGDAVVVLAPRTRST